MEGAEAAGEVEEEEAVEAAARRPGELHRETTLTFPCVAAVRGLCGTVKLLTFFARPTQ